MRDVGDLMGIDSISSVAVRGGDMRTGEGGNISSLPLETSHPLSPSTGFSGEEERSENDPWVSFSLFVTP